MDDLSSYTVKERDVFTLKLSNGFSINTMPLPSGGPIVAMIHNIFSGKNLWNILYELINLK